MNIFIPISQCFWDCSFLLLYVPEILLSIYINLWVHGSTYNLRSLRSFANCPPCTLCRLQSNFFVLANQNSRNNLLLVLVPVCGSGCYSNVLGKITKPYKDSVGKCYGQLAVYWGEEWYIQWSLNKTCCQDKHHCICYTNTSYVLCELSVFTYPNSMHSPLSRFLPKFHHQSTSDIF